MISRTPIKINNVWNMMCDICCEMGETGINILNPRNINSSLIASHMATRAHGPCTLEKIKENKTTK